MLHELAKQMLLATGRFKQAYGLEQKGLPPLGDEAAGPILDDFVGLAKGFVIDQDRRGLGVEYAAGELFRLQLVGNSPYSLEQLRQFTNWYGGLRSRLYDQFRGLFEYEGDSLSDLSNSFPLAGSWLAKKATEGYFRTVLELTRTTTLTHGIKWADFVCKGENYVQSALEASCYDYSLSSLCSDIEWGDGETELFGWANRFEKD